MSALDDLIAAVEAGTAGDDNDKTFDAAFPEDGFLDAIDAFEGSLDAALRLHEALLPGWVWCPEIGPSGPYDGYMSPPFSTDGINTKADNPARSWLLAILRALKAKEAGNE